MDISSMKKVILLMLLPALTGMIGYLAGYYSGINSQDLDLVKTTQTLNPPKFTLPVKDADDESSWSRALAIKVKGEAESLLQDQSIVDVLTEDHAIEVDQLENWHRGVGKALHHATLSKRKPVLAIVLKGDDWNKEQLGTALQVAQKNGISVWILEAES